jgi:glycosyltransferase involved in cell wall biosynthesis
MAANSDIGILTFVPEIWESYWLSRHQIMSRLSKFYKVLWVSTPLSWRQSIGIKKRTKAGRGVRKISATFWTYAPEIYLPDFQRVRAVDQMFANVRVRRIKSLMKAMNIKRIILYIWRPNFAHYVGKFNEELICYHIADEYTFSDIDMPISDRERKLINESDIVFIHSKSLLAKKGTLNSATYYMPNGVDFAYYRQVAEETKPYECELDSIPSPRIGYVGIIKSQIDLELLLEIARRKKDWSIVLVGPVNAKHREIQKHIELLRSESNVYFLGGKQPEALPFYIKRMDVCLMCYRKNDYTRYIYPLKLHEYLACGKPIVAAPLENLKEFEHVLYFAEGIEDWIGKIQYALDNFDAATVQARINVAMENSWDARVDSIRSVFKQSNL